jgi:hypothetical protein
LVIAAAKIALAPANHRPDVLIEREGTTAALRGSHGDLIFPPATAASYSVENWLLADGDDRDADSLPDDSAFRCDPLCCIGRVKAKTVALIREGAALEEDCASPTSSSRHFQSGTVAATPASSSTGACWKRGGHMPSISKGYRYERKRSPRREATGPGFAPTAPPQENRKSSSGG